MSEKNNLDLKDKFFISRSELKFNFTDRLHKICRHSSWNSDFQPKVGQKWSVGCALWSLGPMHHSHMLRTHRFLFSWKSDFWSSRSKSHIFYCRSYGGPKSNLSSDLGSTSLGESEKSKIWKSDFGSKSWIFLSKSQILDLIG